jgi:hypothetical protein
LLDKGVENDPFVGDACNEKEDSIFGRNKGCVFGDKFSPIREDIIVFELLLVNDFEADECDLLRLHHQSQCVFKEGA